MADQKEDSAGAKSHIIMKVDAPPEEKNNTTPQENLQNNLNESKMENSQSSILQKPKLATNNTFTLRSSILGPSKMYSGFVLRPSPLSAKIDSKNDSKTPGFTLAPNRLNPFLKSDSSDSDANGHTSKDTPKFVPLSENKDTPKFVPLSEANEAPKFVPLSENKDAPKFAPESSTTTEGDTQNGSEPTFVFGQNLHERILAEKEPNGEAGPSSSHTNGTSELLFSSAVKPGPTESRSLSESAREYEESRANKRKYEEVAVVTGEEGERNVLQINCKLFAFDKATGNWQERGRGTLRLNDQELNGQQHLHSRLVFRTAGSLRVILNTMIWAEMTIDLASPKSLRLTAMDSSGVIKVFLIMANPEEIKQLHRLLETRVNNEIERHKGQKLEPDCKKPAVQPAD